MSNETETTGILGFFTGVAAMPLAYAWWGISAMNGRQSGEDECENFIQAALEFGDSIEREHGADIKSAVVQAVVFAAVGGLITPGTPPPPTPKG